MSSLNSRQIFPVSQECFVTGESGLARLESRKDNVFVTSSFAISDRHELCLLSAKLKAGSLRVGDRVLVTVELIKTEGDA